MLCTVWFSFASADFEKKIFMWKYLCKKYLQNQGVLVTKFTTSRNIWHSAGTVLLNEKTVAHVLYIVLLFPSQSLSTMKKMIAINVTSLHKARVQRFLQKGLIIHSQYGWSFYKCPTETSGTFTETFMIKKQG